MTRQKSTNHANIGLEDRNDQIAVEMRGLDDIAHGLLEVIDSSEQCKRVQAVDQRERVVAQHLVDVASQRLLVPISALTTQRHQLIRRIRVFLVDNHKIINTISIIKTKHYLTM